MRAKIKDMETLKSMNQMNSQKVELTIKQRANSAVDAVRKQEAELLQQLNSMNTERIQNLTEEIIDLQHKLLKAENLMKFAQTTMQKDVYHAMALHDDLEQTVRTFADSDSILMDTSLYGLIRFTFFSGEPKLGALEIAKVTGLGEQKNGNISETHLPVETTRAKSSPKPQQQLQQHQLQQQQQQQQLLVQQQPQQQQRVTQPSNNNADPVYVALKREIARQDSASVKSKKPTLLFKIDKCGSNNGELRDPLGVACLIDGKIVVAEWGNKRIQLFDKTGRFLTVAGNGKIQPQGVTVTLRGTFI